MITASPTAPPGTVRTLSAFTASTFQHASAAVLCRNNAPLVTHAFACIRRGVPVCILGRDLGASLTKIVKSWKCDNWPQARESHQRWYNRESNKLKKPSQLAALDDKARCLLSIIQSSTSAADAMSKIDKLFTSAATPASLTLATGHKAKGQEWQHVFILDQHLIPSRYAETQADLLQERNLLYVMITRAISTLTYIKSSCWQK